MIDTHNKLVEFGKHKGERWTRVPVSYLKWLINVSSQYSDIAQAELDRRGTIIDWSVELMPHAIDRASLRLRKLWHETSKKDEGLYSWLHRIAKEAWEHGGMQETVHWKGVKFVFETGEKYPVLKTVMLAGEKSIPDQNMCTHPATKRRKEVKKYSNGGMYPTRVTIQCITLCLDCGREVAVSAKDDTTAILPGQTTFLTVAQPFPESGDKVRKI